MRVLHGDLVSGRKSEFLQPRVTDFIMSKLLGASRHVSTVLVTVLLLVVSCPFGDASCPQGLPANCTCGSELVANETLWTVRCSDLTEKDPSFLRLVPLKTEALILQDVTFEFDPEPDAFTLTSVEENQTFLNIRYIRMENLNRMLNVPLHSLLCSFPNLQIASLPKNSLRWATFNASCVPHLKMLNLQWNHIHYVLNNSLMELQSLPDLSLDLSNNLLICDCNLAGLVAWLPDAPIDVLYPDQLICTDGFPEYLASHYLTKLNASQLLCQRDLGAFDEPWARGQNNFGYFLYSVLGFLVVVSLAVLAFGFYYNFPFVRQAIKRAEKKPVMQRRRYKTLDTPT